VDEEWGLVTEGVRCFLDVGQQPVRLTKGGLVETAGYPMFLSYETDIRLFDRVSVDSRYYSVDSLIYPLGYQGYDHKEASVNLIDWDASSATGFWEPGTMDTAFAFDTASPLYLCNVTASGRILRVGIEIEEAFDDITSTLSVGYEGHEELFLSITQNIPYALGYYETAPLYEMSEVQQLKLYISPGASTQGRGYVYVEVQENV
jgi:hypothetical protein